jgi:hypothetical protein
MNLTQKQQIFIEEIRNLVREKKFNPSAVPHGEFESYMKKKGVRVPRQLVKDRLSGRGKKKVYDVYDMISVSDVKETAKGLSKFNTSTEQPKKEDVKTSVPDPEIPDSKIVEIEDIDESVEIAPGDFRNPVYVVHGVDSTLQENFVSVSQSFSKAWENRILVLHDNGDIKEKEALKKLNADGFIYIKSSISNSLFCKITKTELLP